MDARFEVSDQRSSGRVSLGHLEDARNVLSAVTLHDRAVDVDVFVLWIRHAVEQHLDAGHLHLRHVDDHVEAEHVHQRRRSQRNHFAGAQLGAVAREWNEEQTELVGRLRLQVLDCERGQRAVDERRRVVNDSADFLVAQLDAVHVEQLLVDELAPRQPDERRVDFDRTELGVGHVLENVRHVRARRHR